VITVLPVHAQNVLPVIPLLVVLARSVLPELTQLKETLHAKLVLMVILPSVPLKLRLSVMLPVLVKILDV